MAEPFDINKVAIRPELMAFAVAMEMRLRANDHKVGWATMTLCECSYRLLENTHELWETIAAIRRVDPPLMLARTTRIRRQAADVANFAMFIYDIIGREEVED